jgi:hypothetical protein
MLAAVNASHRHAAVLVDVRAGIGEGQTKYSGKMVSETLRGESVAMITMQRGPVRCSRTGSWPRC